MLKRFHREKSPWQTKEEEVPGPSEMVKNPVVLALFRFVIHCPRWAASLWFLALIGSFLLASPYSHLKHRPVKWQSFRNDLKSVQETLAFDFGLAGDSKTTLDNVVVWAEHQQDNRNSSQLLESVNAVEMVLQKVKTSPSGRCDAEALKTMSWKSYSPLMPPVLARNFLAADGGAALVLISNACNLLSIKKELASLDRKIKGIRLALGSPKAVVEASVDDASQQVAEHMVVCAPIMLMLLWWNTGSVCRASTAFLCLLCSWYGTQAITVLVKWCWDDLSFKMPSEVVVIFVQLALCLDYCLFFWTRFSQERRRYPGAQHYREALMTTLQTSGAVITVSVCVLVVGSLSSCFYPDQNALGYLTQHIQMIVGIMLLGFYSLVVPASLAALWPWLFDESSAAEGSEAASRCSCGGLLSWSWSWRLKLKPLDKAVEELSKAREALLTRLSILVTSPPWLVLLPLLVYACLCPLLWELTQFRPNFDMFAAGASRRVPEYEAFQQLERHFNVGQLEPVLVLLEARPLGPASPTARTSRPMDDMAMLQLQLQLQPQPQPRLQPEWLDSNSSQGLLAPAPCASSGINSDSDSSPLSISKSMPAAPCRGSGSLESVRVPGRVKGGRGEVSPREKEKEKGKEMAPEREAEQEREGPELGLRQSRLATSVSLSRPFRERVCAYVHRVLQGTRGHKFEIGPGDVESVWWDRSKGECPEQALLSFDAQALTSKSGQRQVLRLFPPVHATSQGAQDMTRFFWEQTEPQSRSTFDHNGQRYEFRARHFTENANIMLLQRQFAERAPFILVALVLLICCVVGFLFSSVGLGIKMVMTVVVPILAEFGLTVGIFQDGWLGWVGLHETNGLVWLNMYTTVGLLLGLAIDYDIFLFARVYERRMEGFDNISAVRLAMKETASVITVAGTLMCVSYFFIALSPMVLMSQLGVLYCFGVALDTYVIRTILAPSVLSLSESMNYWPGKVPPVTKSWQTPSSSGGGCESARL